jgi:hypothetical protein
VQINSSLANENKIQKVYYKEEYEKNYITQHIGNDYELSKVDHLG